MAWAWENAGRLLGSFSLFLSLVSCGEYSAGIVLWGLELEYTILRSATGAAQCGLAV